jgi:TatD DNase family protein
MIDSHAHLTDDRYAEDVAAVLDRAWAEGIEAVVTVATDWEDSRAAIALAREYGNVFATAGIHPHAASSASDEAFSGIRDLAAAGVVVAIGETGLDYHYDFSPRAVQRDVFELQLRLGAELELPVIVHSREADADLEAMIREHGPAVPGVLHSFSSGRALLDAALEVGWHVSFAGMITFKKYDAQDLVRAVPLDRLMVETDSPYLTPTPYRGRRNEPAHVRLVSERVAEIRGEAADAVARATTRNARRFFGI